MSNEGRICGGFFVFFSPKSKLYYLFYFFVFLKENEFVCISVTLKSRLISWFSVIFFVVFK